jgi:small subunit ribosomal protein S25e
MTQGKQPVTGQKKSKDAIAKAASSKKGGKKKWGKGKSKDKLENQSFIDKKTFEGIEKVITKMKVITVSILHDKYKIIGSIARRLLQAFEAQGKIKKFAEGFAGQYLFAGVDANKPAEVVEAAPKKGDKGKK